MATLNLLELFNGKIFRVPDYQRGYAWEEKQLQELWDDIEEIPESNGVHYTGAVYLEKIPEDKTNESEKWLSGVTFYNIVDGQQRLTSISIFIFELLRSAPEGYCGESKDDLVKTYLFKTNSSGNSAVYKFSYAQENDNHEFLLKNIFEDHSVILGNEGLNLYRKNLIFAKEFLREKLKNLSYSQREIIFKKMTTSLQFDVRAIEKDLDVQAVFETMNNRGKPLSILERLKNRLIYLTEKLKNANKEDKSKLRTKINESWGKIYFWLAKNPDRILDEDFFLSAHLSLYRKPKEGYVFSENAAGEKVFQMFCNKPEKFDEPAVSYKEIEDYIVKLSDAAPVWHEIHNSESLIVKKILLLNNSKELKVFLLAMLLINKDKEKEKQVFSNLEKIIFRNRTLWFFEERKAATWGRDIYSDKNNIEVIEHEIEELIKSEVAAQRIVQEMDKRFGYDRGPKGFYKWGALKYFLFAYEEELKRQFKETADKVHIDDYEDTAIEHIIPQNFWGNWPTVVEGFKAGLEGDDIKYKAEKVLLNTLGNLTILKNGKNSSLGNLGWTDKKNRFSTGSYNEIEISKSNEWTAKEIYERGMKMLSFLEAKIDGLKFTEEEKLKMLFWDENLIKRLPPCQEPG